MIILLEQFCRARPERLAQELKTKIRKVSFAIGSKGTFFIYKKGFCKNGKAFPPNTILEGTLFKEVVVFTNDKKQINPTFYALSGYCAFLFFIEFFQPFPQKEFKKVGIAFCIHSGGIPKIHSLGAIFRIGCPDRHRRAVVIGAVGIAGFGKIGPVVADLSGQVVVLSPEGTPAFCQSLKYKPELGGMEGTAVVSRHFGIEAIQINRQIGELGVHFSPKQISKLKGIVGGFLADMFQIAGSKITKSEIFLCSIAKFRLGIVLYIFQRVKLRCGGNSSSVFPIIRGIGQRRLFKIALTGSSLRNFPSITMFHFREGLPFLISTGYASAFSYKVRASIFLASSMEETPRYLRNPSPISSCCLRELYPWLKPGQKPPPL